MSKPVKKPQDLLTKPIRVAVLGSGGREHALAWKIAQSPLCKQVIVLPGNDGMASAGLKTHVTDLKDHKAVAQTLSELETELVIVGPDDLLAAGIVDDLEAEGYLVFGPSKRAARLEWSKAFAKEIMQAAGVPTAKHALLSGPEPEALASAAEGLGGYPLVLKYDGLALGKGVRICVDRFEAEAFLKEIFENEKFSAKPAAAGAKAKAAKALAVVAEQFLTGHEVSLFALTDGKAYTVLEPVCDHKRLFEGNSGPNTGGMGAYSPVPWLSKESIARFSETVFPPLLEKMREAKAPFKGLLYAGLMVLGDQFWVLEFNARFGDPETQALLPRLDSDVLPLFYGVAVGDLERHVDACPLRWSTLSSVNVVIASRGYPEKPETGFPITGLPEFSPDVRGPRLFFAGVKRQGPELTNSGGRVMSVCCLGESLDSARLQALSIVEKVHFEGAYFRRDIGSVRSHY